MWISKENVQNSTPFYLSLVKDAVSGLNMDVEKGPEFYLCLNEDCPLVPK